MIVCIIGPSGCGKGTQAELLAQELGLPAISTGKLFREEIEEGTDLGLEVKKYTEKGKWVPAPLVMEVLKKKIKREDCEEGFILDGTPRKVADIPLLEELLASGGQKLDVVFHLDTKKETCLGRTQKRIYSRLEEGEEVRADETLALFKERLASYQKTIGPVLSDLEKKGILVRIDNEGSPQEIHQRILSHISK